MLGRADIPAYQRRGNERFAGGNTIGGQATSQLLLTKHTWLLYLIAFFLGRAVFLDNLFPFGLAYFAAVLPNYNERMLGIGFYTFLGLLTVIPFWNSLGYLACLITLCIALSLIYSPEKNVEKGYSLLIPVLLTVFLTKGFFAVLSADWSSYKLMIIFFEALLTGVLAVIFFYGTRVLVGRYSLKMLGVEEMISLIILLSALITGLPQLKIGAFSLGGIIGKTLIMVFALIGGAGVGASLGVTVGVVSSISNIISPLTISLYAFSGLLAGTFKEFGKLGVGIGFILGNVILSLYMSDPLNIVHSLGESAIGLVLMLLVPRAQVQTAAEIVPGTPENIKKQMLYHQRLQGVIGERIKDFSRVFVQLSDTFERVVEKTKSSGQDEILEALQILCRKNCQGCQGYSECWGKNFYHTYQSIFNLLTLAEMKGKVEYQDLPKTFRYKCIHTARLLQTVNYLSDVYKVNYYWQKKLWESRELAVNQLKGVAQVMDSLASQVKIDLDYKEDTERALVEELVGKGIIVEDVAVVNLGDDNIEVQIKKPPCDGQGQCATQITPLISQVLGKEMVLQNNKCACKMGKPRCDLKLCAYLTFDIAAGVASSSSDDLVSGDSFAQRRISSGKAIVMLSDGMGVGPRAALESSATTALLGQLLEAGVEQDVAIQTVNSALILRSPEETFSTVDLAIIDLYTGETDFVKIGSSPSFIKRGQEVITVKASSLPLGILNSVEVEKTQWILRNGDMVVMLTDGILDAFPETEGMEKEDWVVDVLKGKELSHPEDIAQAILSKAQAENGYKKRDDMTIAVIKIIKKGAH